MHRKSGPLQTLCISPRWQTKFYRYKTDDQFQLPISLVFGLLLCSHKDSPRIRREAPALPAVNQRSGGNVLPKQRTSDPAQLLALASAVARKAMRHVQPLCIRA